MLLSIEGRLEWISTPRRVHQSATLDDLLVDVNLGVTGIWRTGVALLMSTHTNDPGSTATDISRGEHQINERRLNKVVVVAPDDSFFIAVHGARALAGHFWLVGPFRR